ncbi:MAG: maleylacetoacetate isomerase [Sinimarinibacterium sp.]|jgi:maleylacetoacetate isomerase
MMLKLYSYWRSSASYRVRIALNLKGLAYETVPVHLARDGGEQFSSAYRALNPQARVPLLVDGDFRLNQSQAIMEYLEAVHPQPALAPAGPRAQARVRAFCLTITADIQPLQNTSVLKYLDERLQVGEDARNAWLRHWITRGLVALDEELRDEPVAAFVFGDAPTWADCVLVPQIYAAQRFGCDAAQYPRLARVAAHCNTLPAFQRAHPDAQPDRP